MVFLNVLLFHLQLSKTPVVSKVSYVNSLDHLLKEKEESRRFVSKCWFEKCWDGVVEAWVCLVSPELMGFE